MVQQRESQSEMTQEVLASSSGSSSRTPTTASAFSGPRRADIANLVTIVGHAATIAPGEWITASVAHGCQFKACMLKTWRRTGVLAAHTPSEEDPDQGRSSSAKAAR